jgi:hypothetical protein
MHGMKKEVIQSHGNEQVNQGHHEYIELWFQEPINSQHSFTLQHFLTSYQSK